MSWLNVVTFVGNLSETDDVTVEFSNVTLYESDWLIHSMNLIVNQSLVSMIKFHLTNKEMDSNISALIINSTFGQLTVDKGCKITIKSSIVEGSVWRKVALMEITNSSLNIINCSFHGFNTISGPVILNATSVTVLIETSSFFDNVGKGGVIQISEGTILSLHSSTFDSNGLLLFAESTILVRSKSWAVIKDCKFSSNIAWTGGCIRIFPGAFLSVENSTFSKNYAAFGGAIYCEGDIYGKHSQNTCKQLTYPTNRNGGEGAQCVIKESYFGFGAALEGGILYVTDTCVKMTNIVFENSGSVKGGGIIAHTSRINMSNFHFTYIDSAFAGSALIADNDCFINMENGYIVSYVGIIGSTFLLQNRVKLFLRNVTLVDEPLPIIKFFGKGYSFFISDHSSVEIKDSLFEPSHSLPWVFYMERSSNLTVCDSIFRGNGTKSSPVLSAAESTRVHFINCSFETCAGFAIDDNSVLSLKRCSITRSQYVVNNALLSASGNSEIVIDENNITDNVPSLDLPFLNVDSSNATLIRCFYTRNYLYRHIVATGNSFIRVSDSHFNNNTFSFGLWYSSIFYLKGSQLSMQNTVFKNNYQGPYLNWGLSAIVDASSSNVGISHCIFIIGSHLTPPTFIFHMNLASISGNPNNFLQINNSKFNNKGGIIRAQDIADINIQSSFFQIDPNNDIPLVAGSGLQLSGLQNLRIADSHFNSSKNAKTQIALKFFPNDFQFLTSKSNFTFETFSIESQEENFFTKAKKFGLFSAPAHTEVKQKETPYASSKYYVKYTFMPFLFLLSSALYGCYCTGAPPLISYACALKRGEA